MLFTAVVALTESVCCVCRDKHHIKKKHKKPTEATNYNGEDCIYVTAEASQGAAYEDVPTRLKIFTGTKKRGNSRRTECQHQLPDETSSTSRNTPVSQYPPTPQTACWFKDAQRGGVTAFEASALSVSSHLGIQTEM